MEDAKQEIIDAIRQGDMQRAEALSLEATNDKKIGAFPWVVIGNIAFQKQNFSNAIRCYNRAVEVDSQNLEAHTQLANIYFCIPGKTYFNLSKAKHHFLKALQISPENPGCLYNLGMILFHEGEINGGIKNLEAALAAKECADEIKFAAQFKLAEIYTETQPLRAKRLYEELVKKSSSKGRAYYGLALLSQQQFFNNQKSRNDLDVALDFINKALLYHDFNFHTHLLAAETYNNIFEINLAKKHINEAEKLNPKHPLVLMQKGIYFSRALQPDKALEIFDEALSIAPKFMPALVSKAGILEKKHRLGEALEQLEKVKTSDRDSFHYYNLRALLHKRNGDLLSAIDDYKRSVTYPCDFWSRANTEAELGRIFDKQKDFSQAFQHFLASKELVSQLHKKGKENNFLNKLGAYEKWAAARSGVLLPKTGGDASKEGPIFFVGFPRSGTTLMERMISSHPDIYETNEAPILPNLLDNAEKLIGRKLSIPLDLFDLTPNELDKMRQAYWKISDLLLGKQTKRRQFFKLPLAIVDLPLIERLFPASKIVVALRDPRDVVLSCFTNVFLPNDAMMNFNSLESTAKTYARVMGLYFNYRSILNLDRHTYRYEDFINSPMDVAKGIIHFIGEQWHEDILNYKDIKSSNIVTTPSYEAVSKPIYQDARGRWRNYEEYMSPILPILEPFVKEFGYK